jgi:ketosteroid isomerase-like protein
MTEQAQLIETFSAAWGAADIDALMALMAEDCWFRASVGPEPGAMFAGREQVRRGFGLFLAGGSSPVQPQTVSEEPLIADDFAVTRWTTRYPQPDGTGVVVRGCDVFGFDGGRIAFKDTYRKVSGELPAAE